MRKLDLKTSISNINGSTYITSRIVISEVYADLQEEKTLAIYLIRQKIDRDVNAQQAIERITRIYFND